MPMREEDKRHFDSIFRLCELAWKQFNERRRFEFKISLTFWTALAAAIAGSVTLGSFPAIPGGRTTLILASLFTFALHLMWCNGIGRAQFADRRIAIFYERKLQHLANAEFDEQLARLLTPLRKHMGSLRNWTYVFQLGVTGLLASALVLVNWMRFG